MFKRKLSELEVRKQLLIAESEVNRLLLTRDFEAVKEGMEGATEPFRNALSLARGAAEVFKAFRRPKKKSEEGSSFGGWFNSGLLQMGLSFWKAYQENKKKADEEFAG